MWDIRTNRPRRSLRPAMDSGHTTTRPNGRTVIFSQTPARTYTSASTTAAAASASGARTIEDGRGQAAVRVGAALDERAVALELGDAHQVLMPHGRAPLRGFRRELDLDQVDLLDLDARRQLWMAHRTSPFDCRGRDPATLRHAARRGRSAAHQGRDGLQVPVAHRGTASLLRIGGDTRLETSIRLVRHSSIGMPRKRNPRMAGRLSPVRLRSVTVPACAALLLAVVTVLAVAMPVPTVGRPAGQPGQGAGEGPCQGRRHRGLRTRDLQGQAWPGRRLRRGDRRDRPSPRWRRTPWS